MAAGAATLWYRDPAARRAIALRFLPWFATLSLAWEAAHVRLYTLWTEAEPAYIAFAVVHCTLGDVLIGSAALFLALILRRERSLANWQWTRIAALTVLVGAGYTAFSEWMNTTLLRTWEYNELMPVVDFAGLEIGVSPLLQWLLIPPLALHLARACGSHLQ